jgi:hypothetical protein
VSKHTPGPWQDEITDDGHLIVRFPHHGNSTVDIYLGDMENTTGEDHANARLIAAAPDLVAALATALVSLEEGRPDCGDCTLCVRRDVAIGVAQSAIKRARL